MDSDVFAYSSLLAESQNIQEIDRKLKKLEEGQKPTPKQRDLDEQTSVVEYSLSLAGNTDSFE